MCIDLYAIHISGLILVIQWYSPGNQPRTLLSKGFTSKEEHCHLLLLTYESVIYPNLLLCIG
jgi:hypothetical protein